ERDEFINDVLAYLVKSLAEDKERELLVQLLSTRCPTWIDWPQPIEYYLAVQGNRLADPVMVLGDAFTRSEVPETRMVLALAIRRAFDGFGIGGRNDREFVKN